MPRTTINATASPGKWPTAAVNLPATAADVPNKNATPWAPNLVIIAFNSHATTPYTATVTSVVDSHKRSGDIGPKTIAAGEFAIMFDSVAAEGFQQSADGKVYYEANNAAVKFIPILVNS